MCVFELKHFDIWSIAKDHHAFMDNLSSTFKSENMLYMTTTTRFFRLRLAIVSNLTVQTLFEESCCLFHVWYSQSDMIDASCDCHNYSSSLTVLLCYFIIICFQQLILIRIFKVAMCQQVFAQLPYVLKMCFRSDFITRRVVHFSKQH